MANDKRIPELPPLPGASGAMLIPVYDPISDITYRGSISQINPSQPDRPDQWLPGENYLIGDIVSHDAGVGLQIWIAAANNTGSPPSGSNPDWDLIAISPSGLVAWQAGLFNVNQASVLFQVNTKWRLFVLAEAAPFVSSNFLTELENGDWHDVASTLLPFANLAGFPVVGERGKTYCAIDTNFLYRWNGATYIQVGGGGVAIDYTRRTVFRFNSNLFTEQALSFRGLISLLSESITNELTSVSYESRLDVSAVWVVHANLAALQSWINSNVTGTEAAGTRFWIKCLATYSLTGIGVAENTFNYTAS
jgi:hypothetical protein